MQITEIKRRRHGKYDHIANSHRQCTVCYLIPFTDGHTRQVCKITFQEIFGVRHRFLQTLQGRKKNGISVYVDNRKGNAHRKTFNDSDQQKIKDHINSFPRDESHYGRAKSCKEYLSPDLNV